MTEELEKQYEFMLDTKIRQIFREEIEKHHKDRDDALLNNHKLIMDEIGTLKKQLAPVVKIYRSFDGFGTILSWFFKYLIIPLSVLVGIFYEGMHILKK